MKNYLSNKFICATKEYSKRGSHVNAPYIRRQFELNNTENTEIYICGLGFYKLYINGKDITKGLLAPYISNPNEVVYYDKYDISKYLNKGRNAMGVILGNGMQNSVGGSVWDFDKNPERSSPKLALSLVQNGEVVLECDDKFKTHPSPITFDDTRIGEYYDANLEVVGWNLVDFDDSDWNRCIKAKKPLGKKKICEAEPITLQREIKAKRIIPSEGGFIYDFGIDCTGVCELKVKGDKNQKITMQHGEVLLEDKFMFTKNLVCDPMDASIWQLDKYIAKGGGKVETYTPSFTYHGFRYVFVFGIYPAQATEDLLTYKVYNSNFDEYSSFTCDNNAVNSIQKITINSDLSNFYYFPTDCPHREKNGWTGDIALSAEQLLYNFNCVKSLNEWLYNVRVAQKESGQLPGIVPTFGWGYVWGNGPAWDLALTEVPYEALIFNGDKKIVKENIEAIDRNIDFMCSRTNENGLFSYGLGDWCECSTSYGSNFSTPLEITDTLTAIEIFEKASFMAERINRKDLVQKYNKLVEKYVKLFREKHIQKDLYVDGKTQTSQAKALSLNIFTEEEKPTAVKNLVELIKLKDDHFCVGVIGARVLFRVLSDNGYQDLALKLITQDSYPSYKYWVDRDYTGLGEQFYETEKNSILRNDGNTVLSFNHHFWGDVSGYFYKYICGLRVNENGKNPNNIVISPLVYNNINNVKCKYVRNGNILEYEVIKINNKNVVKIIQNTGFNVVKKL